MKTTLIRRYVTLAVALMLCMSFTCFSNAENGNGYPDYLNLDSLLPIVKWDHEPITLKILVKREATVDIENVWFWQWAEQNMNLKFEIEEVTSASLTERKSTMFASQDLPDIMFNLGLKPAEYTTYGQNEGELLALNDYINEILMPNAYADREEMPIAFIACTCANGKMYGLPRLAVQWQGAGDTIGDLRMFINAKWLEACGLDAPETLDDFVEMLRTFKEMDPMGLGESMIPVIDNGGKLRSYIWNALGFIDGDGYGTAPSIKNGEIEIPCGTEEYREFVQVMNTMYEEGLISKDYFLMDATQVRAKNLEGVAGVLGDSAPYLSVPETFGDWISAPLLTSDVNPTQAVKKGSAYTYDTFAVSAKTEYPEVVMRFMDFFYSDIGSLYSWWGPRAGYEETLGILGGYRLSDDGTDVVALDVLNGNYANWNAYRQAILGFNLPADMRTTDDFKFTSIGAESQMILDPLDGDDHYRMILLEAHAGHLVDGLPPAYFNVEDIAVITDLTSVIANHVKTETAKFVTGKRPLSELDQYYDELDTLGYQKLKEYYTDVYADYIDSLK